MNICCGISAVMRSHELLEILIKLLESACRHL